MVVPEKVNALNRSRIYDFKKKTWRTVRFDDTVYLANGARMQDYTSTAFRMTYQSPLEPPSVLDVEMAT